MRLDIELYIENDMHCAWIADDCGGSGIEVKADNYEDFAKEIGMYLANYSFAKNDEEEFDDGDDD